MSLLPQSGSLEGTRSSSHILLKRKMSKNFWTEENKTPISNSCTLLRLLEFVISKATDGNNNGQLSY